jgi:starvation-inducible DNA-binding protein
METTLTAALTDSLVELIDLSLLAKQAHWTVIGCHFRETHAHLDEIAALASDSADLVAERAVAAGRRPKNGLAFLFPRSSTRLPSMRHKDAWTRTSSWRVATTPLMTTCYVAW